MALPCIYGSGRDEKVREETRTQEEEEGHEELGSAAQVGHGLAVYRVHGKDHPTQHGAQGVVEDVARDEVGQDLGRGTHTHTHRPYNVGERFYKMDACMPRTVVAACAHTFTT